MEAVRLKQVDMDYRNHLQAFLNFAVKAEKKFYDYEKEIAKATKKKEEKSRFAGIGKLLSKGE